MSAELNVPTSWTTFRMLAQIFVAFGQGAGQLPVSDDAVQAATADYAEKIDAGGDWGQTGPIVLGIARVMGQAAAAHALREGRPVITARDYTAARALIHEGHGYARMLLGGCPW